MANKLIRETSPYLLQHAHNPVQWYPWGNEALEKAKKEDKPIIVSIGYSACHWCHVMERECFEKEELAAVMNAHFVSIKVDREERPDIDQIYMDAVQAMGIHGGWPLNVFLMPDARPFYGGTYFPPKQWAQVLVNVKEAFVKHREDLEESAHKFTEYLAASHSDKYGLKPADGKYNVQGLHKMYSTLSANFDTEKGGPNRAPKFPMPTNYLFLLRYFAITGNDAALQHVQLTLDQMASGGIYDQLGGGFARYSVDADWFAPHFEKMLYDNAQLITLYAEAYTLTGIERYKEVVYETIAFVQRELTHSEGGFYSALDADTEGEEGKFYVWTKEEVDEILQEDSPLFCEYYNVKEEGNWEHNYNILNIKEGKEELAARNGISHQELNQKIISWKVKLMEIRSKRNKPGLDDKILTSWNGLMLKGLVDAYWVFNEPVFLDLALKNAEFILSKLLEGQALLHSYKYSSDKANEGRATILGYLEDYAAVIQGLLALYQATFEEKWLYKANELAQYTLHHFYDPLEDMFFFTDDSAEKLIARKKEFFDNVIPASNSIMATNLYFLGTLLADASYLEISGKMLARAESLILNEPSHLSNWASLYSYRVVPTLEIAIVGEDIEKIRKELQQYFIPNKVLCGSLGESNLPLLQDRIAEDRKTTIYVCFNHACKRPVFSVEEALDQIRELEAVGMSNEQ